MPDFILSTKKTVSDLRRLGVVTPFEFGGLAKATKLMLAMRATTTKQLIKKKTPEKK